MPNYTRTTATEKVARLRNRFRLIAGGTSASKTISIEMVLIDLAMSDYQCSLCQQWGCLNETHKKMGAFTMHPKLTSIVSESFPHLRRGAIRDFQNIMQDLGYWKDARWNKSEFTYTFETGSKIEFFSADMPSKVRGPRRDRLFVNEANNVARESFEQLALRTREIIFADWNPVAGFYLYDEHGLVDEPAGNASPYAEDPDADFLILTYKDNEALEEAIVRDIEKRRMNRPWWRVYGKGLRGELEGKIFKDWKIIDKIPHEARLEARGLDFGYARDKLAICDIYRYSGGFIIDELVSRVGMLNRQAADQILLQPDPNVLTIADSAEQKSIAEMQEYGVNIIGVQKIGTQTGAISGNKESFTNSAIQFVQAQRISITKSSTNFIKSYRNFMWQTDKDGNIIPKYDHYMSDEMMSVVYGMTAFAPREAPQESYSSGNFEEMWI